MACRESLQDWRDSLQATPDLRVEHFGLRAGDDRVPRWDARCGTAGAPQPIRMTKPVNTGTADAVLRAAGLEMLNFQLGQKARARVPPGLNCWASHDWFGVSGRAFARGIWGWWSWWWGCGFGRERIVAVVRFWRQCLCWAAAVEGPGWQCLEGGAGVNGPVADAAGGDPA